MVQFFMLNGESYPVIDVRNVTDGLAIRYAFLRRSSLSVTLTVIESDKFLGMIQGIFDLMDAGDFDSLPLPSKKPCEMCSIVNVGNYPGGCCNYCYLFETISLFVKKKILSFECKGCGLTFDRKDYAYRIAYTNANRRYMFDICKACYVTNLMQKYCTKRGSYELQMDGGALVVDCEICGEQKSMDKFELTLQIVGSSFKKYCKECILKSSNVVKRAVESNDWFYYGTTDSFFYRIISDNAKESYETSCFICHDSHVTWRRRDAVKTCNRCASRFMSLMIEKWYVRCLYGHWVKKVGKTLECPVCKISSSVSALVDKINDSGEKRDFEGMSDLCTKLKVFLRNKKSSYL